MRQEEYGRDWSLRVSLTEGTGISSKWRESIKRGILDYDKLGGTGRGP